MVINTQDNYGWNLAITLHICGNANPEIYGSRTLLAVSNVYVVTYLRAIVYDMRHD